MKRICELALLLLLIFPSVECSRDCTPSGPGDESPPPSRILFIGNSLTFYNGGVDTQLEGLLAASESFPMITAESSAFGGFTLQYHWYSSSTMDAIWNGNWDAVVLQEHSTRSITETENMYTYARLLDEKIGEAGAQTVFFMTWAPESDPDRIEDLDSVYTAIADELGTALAPVGRAWQRSLQEKPGLSLHDPDGLHPNHHGTYLSACVFYSVLWRQSPESNLFRGHSSITLEEREFLQRVAWETVQAEGE